MGQLVIEQKDGTQHLVLFDNEDENRILAAGKWSYSNGYATRCRPSLRMHRFILGLQPSDPIVDHENGNTLDNRKANLRLSDYPSNIANQAIVNNRGTSKYRGVSLDRRSGKWKAQVKLRGKKLNLGLFAVEYDAYLRVCDFRVENSLGGY